MSNHNYRLTDINVALPLLLEDLLAHGAEVESRAGLTKELTHVGITLTQPWRRELLLADRKHLIAAQIAETMWVLSGRDDMEFLSKYLPRAIDFSDDGLVWRAGYGARLRHFMQVDGVKGSKGIDQIEYVVNTLRASHSSRQAVAVIWDPVVDTTPSKDIPCNDLLNFSIRDGKLDLHVFVRSNDAVWGWSGINAFEWSALMEVVAGMVGVGVGSLHFAVTSFHLYDRHFDKARLIADNNHNSKLADPPRFNALGLDDMASFDYLCDEWFRAEETIRTGQPYDVESFPEPMLQSWLRVLQWWWSGDMKFLAPLEGTRLHRSCVLSVQPSVQAPAAVNPFVEFVNELHSSKHAAYGDSWKRRGEYMILANIARKVDRLGGGTDTPDETQADTALDLLVYLAKYRCWLSDGSGDPVEVAELLYDLAGVHGRTVYVDSTLTSALLQQFTELEVQFDISPDGRKKVVDDMLPNAYALAFQRWRR